MARRTIDLPQLVAVAALAAGCAHLHPAETPYCPECPIPVARADPESSCPDWRWIGVLAPYETRCPVPDAAGWSVRPLFPDPDPGRSAVPEGLRPFCLYEHADAGGDLAAAPLPGIVSLGRDCMTVHPAASSLARAALPALEAHVLRQAGGGIAAALPAPLAGGLPGVRLALLDTAPTREAPAAPAGAGDRSPHGYTLANLAERLTCSPGGTACVARVTSRLALPWVVYEPSSRALSVRDDVRGGFVGFVGELAEAIRGEVVAWQAAATPPALVLNLSLGWNPRIGWDGRPSDGLQDDVATMRPAVQAVHAAFVDAVCRGVPAVAAAGNRTWGPDPEPSRGPLLPAAWERRAAPTAAACATALAPGGPPAIDDASSSSYRPLVTAIGAVDAEGSPLRNARFDAEPRLVAFGDHAVVTARERAAPTAMLTGSSVATLVASAALAQVRAYRPDLDAFEAMDVVYQSGRELGRPAEWCLGAREGERCPATAAQPVRRVLTRAAAREACTACSGPGCPAPCPAAEPPPVSGPVALGGGVAREFDGAPRRRLADLAAAAPTVHSACPPAAVAAALRAAGGEPAGPERFHGSGQAPVYPCPHWQFFDTAFHALTGPQPGSDPCPTCGFGGGPGDGSAGAAATSAPTATLASSGELYIEIDEDYVGDLSQPVLKVGDATYALPDLAPGDRLVVSGVTVGPGDTLQLSFLVNGVRSATSVFLRAQVP